MQNNREERIVRGRRRTPGVRVGESVAEILRDKILRGELASGVELPKQESLAAKFGVSAPSIREAFRVLEAEGLVTVRRGNLGGAVVHLPTADDVSYALGLVLQSDAVTFSDVSTALATLDELAVRLCAERKDRLKVVVPALQASIDESEQSIESAPDWSAGTAFHHLIADHCGNRTIQLLARSVWALWAAQEHAWFETHHDSYVSVDERRHIIDAHRRIVELIASGSVTEAQKYARHHLDMCQELLMSRTDRWQVVESSRRSGTSQP